MEEMELRHLWLVVGSYGEFQVFMPIDSGFRVDSSGARSQKCGFFDCKNVEKSWWIACFLW